MSLRKNSLYLTISALLRLAVSIMSVPFLIRLLGLERYGIWAVVTSLPLLGIILEFGLPTAVSKFLPEANARQDQLGTDRILTMSFLILTILGSLAFAVLFSFAHFLSELLFQHNPFINDARLAIGIMGIFLLLSFWQDWITSVEGGLMRYDIQAKVDAVGSIALTLGTLLIAWLTNRLFLLAVWWLIVTTGIIIAHVIILNQLLAQKHISFQFSWQTGKSLFQFGSMQWLSSLGSSLFGYSDRIIVNYFLGPSAAGIYAAATSVVTKINQISAMPLQVIPTWISAAKALSQKSRIHHIFIRATRLNGLFVFFIAAPVMFWAQPLARLLMGPTYSEQVAQLLQSLALIYGLYSLAGAGFYAAIGIGSPEINAFVGIVSGLLFIIALSILIPAFGIEGAIWANAVYILVLAINWKVKNLIDMTTKEYLSHLAPSVIALLVCWFASLYFYSFEKAIVLKTIIFLGVGAVAIFYIASRGFLSEIIRTPFNQIMKWKSGIPE